MRQIFKITRYRSEVLLSESLVSIRARIGVVSIASIVRCSVNNGAPPPLRENKREREREKSDRSNKRIQIPSSSAFRLIRLRNVTRHAHGVDLHRAARADRMIMSDR